MAKNQEYIDKWVAENRPDLIPHFKELADSQFVVLVMAIAFEAGRMFQIDHPELIDPSAGDYVHVN